MDTINQIQTKIPTIIYFDEAYYLRERTSDINMLIQLIAQTEMLYHEPFDNHQYMIASTLGYLYRIYGFDEPQQLMKAELYFNHCLTYATQELDIAKEITTCIRLGEVYKYQDKHEQALAIFQKAILLCEGTEALYQLDFAYQHLGKCLIEMGRYNEAEAVLRDALHLRIQKGNQSLIDSTMQALELTDKLKENNF